MSAPTYAVAGLIAHAGNVVQDMAYAEAHGYPLARTCDELQAALDAIRATVTPCGNRYGTTGITCAEPTGHVGDHTAPTGDDDGVWAWAR